MIDRFIVMETTDGHTIGVIASDWETNAEVISRLPSDWKYAGIIDNRSPEQLTGHAEESC